MRRVCLFAVLCWLALSGKALAAVAGAGALTPLTCTNQFFTAYVSPNFTCTTATLASAQFANQGTTTTLLHGNAAGNPSFTAVVNADLNITATTCSNQFLTAISSTATVTCTTATLASAQFQNQGTTTTLLHGNAAGNPSFTAVVSADLNITTTTCTNQFVTALSAAAAGTCTTATLASAQFQNQGTTTTVLHGNAAGNPSFAAVSLTADVSGILPTANGGTGIAFFTAAGPTVARVYTFPDAAATVLTTNAAVTCSQGGTGNTTYAVGDILYASGACTLSRLADVAVGSYLRSGGVGTAPFWSTLVLPNAATVNQVVYASAANTYGGSNNLLFDGTTLAVGGSINNTSGLLVKTNTGGPGGSIGVGLNMTLPAGANGDVLYGQGIIGGITYSTGTFTGLTAAVLAFNGTSMSKTGTGTIDNASSIDIVDAPTIGTTNFALRVRAGAVRFPLGGGTGIISAGAVDSGGAGFRTVLVPN